jgi:hypothetical protein
MRGFFSQGAWFISYDNWNKYSSKVKTKKSICVSYINKGRILWFYLIHLSDQSMFYY